MPSSISNFEVLPTNKAGGASRAMAILTAGLVVLGVVAELAGSLGISHVSRIQRRIDAEASDALNLARTGTSGRPTLLLIGNSLILEGTDFPELKTLVADKYDAHRFIIEQTLYTDWYFELKRIFRHGSRPSRVVLSLSVGHLLADTTRGEYAAHYAMDVQDLPELVRREHLDTTTASNLLFAHYSGWLGARAEIRKWLLARILPDAANLASVLGFRAAPRFAPELMRAITPARLREMKALCAANGAKFIFLVPPVATTEDGSNLLSQIGGAAGVPVVIPVKPGEFSKSLFRDGFHLSGEGAAKFTPKLAKALLGLEG